ncbi:MAG: sugar phosphate isomerase/epimerase family protein [Planctomycetota bacterium]|nr:sugar phosphate isomerase/epimerase family protein [Planctomycetota bacterium]
MNEPATHTRRSFCTLGANVAAALAAAPHVALGRTLLRLAAPFAPDIGVCTSIGNADVLRRSGAAYVEDSVRRLLIPDKPDAAFARQLDSAQACGLPVRAANGFLPGSLKCVGPQASHERVLAFAETAFRRAARVGIEVIVFGSSGARSIPDGFDRRRAELQFVALLGKMSILARRYNVTVAVEPLNRDETNFINTVEEGARLVEAVQHPNIMLVADIYHMLREDEPPAHIRAARAFIHHVHIAEQEGRTAPGVHGEDFTPYFQALGDIGFDGPISIECRWRDLAAQLPRAMTTMRDQMARVA